MESIGNSVVFWFPKEGNAVFPLVDEPLRISVGVPGTATSNSWRFWVSNGNLYVKCRDNFAELKTSLHGNRWRVGFTREAAEARPDLLPSGRNRAWEVWDPPPPIVPGVVIAFHLVFSSAELAVEEKMKKPKDWKGVIYVEPPTQNKITMITVYVADRGRNPPLITPESVQVARYTLADNKTAFIVVQYQSDQGFHSHLKDERNKACERMLKDGVPIPQNGYFYFHGYRPDGSRYYFGARATPAEL